MRFRLGTFLTILLFALGFSGSAVPTTLAENSRPEPAGTFDFPFPLFKDGHMRKLVENCFSYASPQTAVIDPASGYPFEGWNQEPENGLYLRSFTQLTAIGSWIELLANIAAGFAENPHLSRADALRYLEHALKSLRDDQRNPSLSAKGLLVNFLDLGGGTRKGPLEETVDCQKFLYAFGEKTGTAIWQALQAQGWISPEKRGLVGRVRRTGQYGYNYFIGPLAPFAGEQTKIQIMKILDARALLVVFGDNVNLTASMAKAIGALLRPGFKDNPQATLLRDEMELFIESQKEGYRSLYDEKNGTFAFGWDAGRNRFIGWDDGAGNWVTGRMNYFINEFRGAWIFTVLRYGIPRESIMNAGFKVKPYHDSRGSVNYGLCAWDGSAFQLLGFNVFMGELRSPGWRTCLERVLDIELDYSRRCGLPGFLSEAYSGNGVEYTRFIGIPDIAVTNRELITYAPSLYTLGVGYLIAPDKLMAFLDENWAEISKLLTDHGPWEGYNTRNNAPVRYQTTTHTLSLILAALGSADENMRRYLDWKGLTGALDELYKPGSTVDLLAMGAQPVAWTTDGSPITFSRDGAACRFKADFQGMGGIAFPVPQEQGISLAGGMLRLRYRCATDVRNSRIILKRTNPSTKALETIPVEIMLEMNKMGEQEVKIEICLPATPCLQGVKEISLVWGEQGQRTEAGMTLIAFDFSAL